MAYKTPTAYAETNSTLKIADQNHTSSSDILNANGLSKWILLISNSMIQTLYVRIFDATMNAI